jgi:tRNA-dihydrouridine synthase B
MIATKIRNIELNPALVLSPMSGVTTSAFRRLIKELNPGSVGLVISEFISVEGMTRKSRRSLDMMRYHESERPYGIQIFGYDIQRMRDAAVMVEAAGADLVDINCGCPAPKVVKRGGGCELMRQPEHLSKILREVRKAVSIPLTLKMRSGWDEGSLNSLEIARIAEAEGVEAITVHGRTRAQLYRGLADWTAIKEIVDEVKIPVFGSGDVIDRDSADSRMTSGVKGLFIGRGALSNPFVFSEIMQGKKVYDTSDVSLVLRVIELYISLLKEEFPPRSCIGKVKQLVSQFVRGHEWRRELCRANTMEDQLTILNRIKDENEFRPQQLSERDVAKVDAWQML